MATKIKSYQCSSCGKQVDVSKLFYLMDDNASRVKALVGKALCAKCGKGVSSK